MAKNNYKLETMATTETDEKMSMNTMETDSSFVEEQEPESREGWRSYLVLVVCFISYSIGYGALFSYGILLQDLKSYFLTDYSRLTLPSSIQFGVGMWGALYTGSFVDHFGIRLSGIIGGTLATAGLVMASFARSLAVFTLGYGLLSGAGCSFLLVLVMVSVQLYFDRNRSLATGVTMAGSGIGLFVIGPLSRWLLEQYTWRGCILILGGIILQCVWLWLLVPPCDLKKEGNGGPGKSSNLTLPKKLFSTLKSTVDITLFKNLYFSLYLLALFPTYLAWMSIYVFAPDKGTEIGFSKDETKWFTSCLGIGDLLGKIAIGMIGNARSLQGRSLHLDRVVVALTSAGLIIIPFCRTLWSMYLALAICGFTTGGHSVVLRVVIVDLVGRDLITAAMARVLMMNGIAMLIANPLAGLVRDSLDSYDAVFYLFGGYFVLAFFIMCFIPATRRPSIECYRPCQDKGQLQG